jgi:hypothetical protein
MFDSRFYIVGDVPFQSFDSEAGRRNYLSELNKNMLEIGNDWQLN